jgi:hypothetical protein
MMVAGSASAMSLCASTTLKKPNIIVMNPRMPPHQAHRAAGLTARQQTAMYFQCHLDEALIVSRSPLRTWAAPS